MADERFITRADLQEELKHYATKADLAALETRLVKWAVGLQLGGIAAISAIVAIATKLFS